MDLNTFYKKYNETDVSFAKKAGLNQPTLWRIRNLKVVPRAATALEIEQATNGEVTAMELLLPKDTATRG